MAQEPTAQPEPPAAPPAGAPLSPPERHPPEIPAVLDERGNRKWVYAAAIQGVFRRWRRALGYFVIAVYFVMPWITVGGMPSILLQIPERRFILFGTIFWPQDLFYLVFLLIGLTLALFFFTAVAGRVWCGWLCPQTVFIEEVFRKIEEWTEGDHHQQRRRDRAPWSWGKLSRKAAKHALFLAVSALVSNTFIAYFVGVDQLLIWMVGSPLDHGTAFLFMASILALFYFDFAWFREQFCIVLCPYARFQSVLTDAHTLQVGYDVVRGEPRGKLGSTTGDCVHCFKCVVVCPTGIDIRDGYQLECIGCARCIDACDSIMDRIGRPRGLVRYDSLARLGGERTRLFRPRVVIYSALLVGIVAALFVALATRPQLDFTLLRPPGAPFSLLPNGMVSNHVTLRLLNHAQEARRYRLAMAGPPGSNLVTPINPLTVAGGSQTRAEAFVNLPAGALNGGKAPVRLQVFAGDLLLAEKALTVLGPVAR